MDTITISIETRSLLLALVRVRLREINESIETIKFDSPFYRHYIGYRTSLETALSEIGYEQNHD